MRSILFSPARKRKLCRYSRELPGVFEFKVPGRLAPGSELAGRLAGCRAFEAQVKGLRQDAAGRSREAQSCGWTRQTCGQSVASRIDSRNHTNFIPGHPGRDWAQKATGRMSLTAEQILEGRRPRHVGIIMDGNGRWALARGLPRVEGHRRGVEALRKAIRTAGDYRIPYVTIYAFSAENWRRPAEEVGFLMGLLKRFIRRDLAELHSNGVRVRVIGSRKDLPEDILSLLLEAEERTKDNRNMTLAVAFNYGGRQELTEAARELARKAVAGELDPERIDEAMISDHLTTAGMPDPDLIIRTSGEQRLSNFLLWQAAYSELVFLPIFWPDFDAAAFAQALQDYARRERRYGDVSAIKPPWTSAMTG